MGTYPVDLNGKRNNGADGAYETVKTEKGRRLIKACVGVANYLVAAGETINGVTYGSDDLFLVPANLQGLCVEVGRIYLKEYGEYLGATPEQIGRVYSRARKGCYVKRRKGIAVEREAYPLFGDNPEDEKPIAVVYAYWGSNQIAHRRLIKIGYTAEDLGTYLHRLERAYDPRLMASQVGGVHEEDLEKAKYRRWLREGREWFEPTRQMFDDFRREWRITHDFEAIAAEALKQSQSQSAPEPQAQ